MKATIKEVAKREGKKSEVAVGNIREVLSKQQDLIAEESVASLLNSEAGHDHEHIFTAEFCEGLLKKANAILKKKKSVYRFDHIMFNTAVKTAPVKEIKKKK